MEKLLVGIDEEHASQVAVDWVIERVKRAPARVVLFTAFDMLASDPVADDSLLLRTRARIEEAGARHRGHHRPSPTARFSRGWSRGRRTPTCW